MRKLTTCTITYPSGGAPVVDNRPGHTLAGLLYYYDPFQRESHHSASIRRQLDRAFSLGLAS